MQTFLLYMLVATISAQQFNDMQPNFSLLDGLGTALGPLSPLLGTTDQSGDKSKSSSNLGLWDILRNGLAPSNPAMDLLTHGIGFGLAALRELGTILQNSNQQNNAPSSVQQ